MQYFVYKLLPARQTFAQDMNPQERAIMQQHVVYWRDHLKNGNMYIFGPVLDPAGPYGLGIIKAMNEEQAREWIKDDPASTLHGFELYEMLAVTGA